MPNLRREFSRRGLLSGAWRANAVPTAVRPPGAVGEEQFVGLCDGCGACAQACPVGAVQMTGPRVANGAPSPQIIAAAAACTMCEGLVCSTACPQGALTRTTPGSMRIAEVEFHPRDCWTLQGIEPGCSYCFDYCPLRGSAITYRRGSGPEIHSGTCTGCGTCVFLCPAQPKAIAVA